jgi:putative ABC transport system ATP-binding protein
MAMIRAARLAKWVSTSQGRLDILRPLDLELPAGASCALLGPSGSGKSTLLALLAGLDTPSAGEVWLGGERLGALGEDARAALRLRTVGFVFQTFELLPALTAQDNVALPLELAGARDAAARAGEMLGRVGLGARARHYPAQLSGGEQQRVALARAFVARPRALFADEPTGNLDRATGAQVIALLLELNREHGATLLVATHDSALAARLDRRLHLDAGVLRVGD